MKTRMLKILPAGISALALAFSSAGHATMQDETAAENAAATINAADNSSAAADLPILGLAQTTIKISNLDASRAFYRDILGFAELFNVGDPDGNIVSTLLKVNDEQYIELVPGLEADELIRQTRFVIQTSDLDRLHQYYTEQELNPGPIAASPGGNRIFRLRAPNDQAIDFMQYMPDSQQMKLKGQLMPDARIGTRLSQVGTLVTDDDTRTFFRMLGLERQLPGPRGDELRILSTSASLEAQNPAPDPDSDAYKRALYGAVYHLSIEVADIDETREDLKARGKFSDADLQPATSSNGHGLLNIHDPDGTRIRLIGKEPLPAS